MKLHINPDTKHIINYVQDTPDGGVIAQAGNAYIYVSPTELAKYIPVDNHFAKKVEPKSNDDLTLSEKTIKDLKPVIRDNVIHAYIPCGNDEVMIDVTAFLRSHGYIQTGKQPALDFKQIVLTFKKVKKCVI